MVNNLKFRANDLYLRLQEMEDRMMSTLAHVLAEWGTTRYVPVTWDGQIAPRVVGGVVPFKELVPEGFQWPFGVVAWIQWAGESSGTLITHLEESVSCPVGKTGQCVWLSSIQLAPFPVEKNLEN